MSLMSAIAYQPKPVHRPSISIHTEYLVNTRHFTPIQHGAYLLLLLKAARFQEDALPDNDQFLATRAGLTLTEWKKNKDVVLSHGWLKREEDGYWTHPALVGGRVR
jgi:uncharacterized protein YdaU (DUF1376 family)